MRTTSRFIPLLVGPSKESRFCCSLLLVWLHKPIYRNECKRPTFWHKAAKHSDNSHLARRVRTSAIDGRPNGLTSTLCEQRFVNSEDLNLAFCVALSANWHSTGSCSISVFKLINIGSKKLYWLLKRSLAMRS